MSEARERARASGKAALGAISEDDNTPIVDLGQDLLNRGFAIIPLHGVTASGGCTCGNPNCTSVGKHPATLHGIKDATKTAEGYKALCKGRRNLNVGIVTSDDFFVTDIDGLVGEEALAKACPNLPKTLTCKTGRGRHLFFRRPKGVRIKSHPVLPKVDCKADGGCVVGAGSRHASGNLYSWVDPNAPIADAPEELLALVCDPPRDLSKKPTKAENTNRSFAPHRAPATAALMSSEGGRNQTIFDSACQLRREGRTEEEIFAILRLRAEPDFPEDEIRRTIKSAIKTVDKEIKTGASHAAIVVRGDAITPKAIDFLWDGFFAKGKVHVFAGVGGEGKSTAAFSFAATITTGGRWPDGRICKPGNVMIWSGEDQDDDTILPRFIGAGGDTKKVFIVKGVGAGEEERAFDPSIDLPTLRPLIEEHNIVFLIIDPLVSAIAGDSHKNAETRRGLQPLVDLGRDFGVCIFGISHFSKNTQGNRPLERITGSLAVGAACRVAFACARDAETGERIFCRVKSNIGPDGGGFRFSLEQVEIEGGISAQRVVWGSPIEGSATKILDEAETGKKPSAEDFLREALAGGAVSSADLQERAREVGIGWRSVETAKKRLGIVVRRSGYGKGGRWFWSMPEVADDFLTDEEKNEMRAWAAK